MSDEAPNVMAYRLRQLEEQAVEQSKKLITVEKENAALKAEVDGVKTHQISIEKMLNDQGVKLDKILERLANRDIQDAHNKGKFTGGWWVLSGLIGAASTIGALIATYFQKP